MVKQCKATKATKATEATKPVWKTKKTKKKAILWKCPNLKNIADMGSHLAVESHHRAPSNRRLLMGVHLFSRVINVLGLRSRSDLSNPKLPWNSWQCPRKDFKGGKAAQDLFRFLSFLTLQPGTRRRGKSTVQQLTSPGMIKSSTSRHTAKQTIRKYKISTADSGT